MLIGNVSLDRDKNKAVSNFELTEDTEFQLDNRTILASAITNSTDLNSSSELSIVMRMHFVVHTFINLYVTDGENEIIGIKSKERNGST